VVYECVQILQFGVLGAFRTLRAAWPAYFCGGIRERSARPSGKGACTTVGCGWHEVSPAPQDLYQGPRGGD